MSYNGSGMEYPCKKGVPTEGSKNTIWPQEEGKKSNPAMEKSLFDFEANKIDGSQGYGKSGSKGGMVDKGVVSVKKNVISPTADY